MVGGQMPRAQAGTGNGVIRAGLFAFPKPIGNASAREAALRSVLVSWVALNKLLLLLLSLLLPLQSKALLSQVEALSPKLAAAARSHGDKSKVLLGRAAKLVGAGAGAFSCCCQVQSAVLPCILLQSL